MWTTHGRWAEAVECATAMVRGNVRDVTDTNRLKMLAQYCGMLTVRPIGTMMAVARIWIERPEFGAFKMCSWSHGPGNEEGSYVWTFVGGSILVTAYECKTVDVVGFFDEVNVSEKKKGENTKRGA